MTGIRKRVTVGFLSIVCLLFFSGMLSFLELNVLSRDTGEILEAHRRNIELAKQMLDAAHEQGLAFTHLSMHHDARYDSLCRAGMNRLEQTLEVAQEEAADKSSLDSLSIVVTELRLLTDRFLARFAEQRAHEQRLAVEAEQRRLMQQIDTLALFLPDSIRQADSLAMLKSGNSLSAAEDYLSEQEQHDALYRRLTTSIQHYMTSAQSALAPRTEQLRRNAYRAVTPVLISLLVMIAIVLLLYYLMLLYCVNPILRINRSLGEWLQFRIPYRPKGDLQDELKELSEKIDTLINLSKHNPNNR